MKIPTELLGLQPQSPDFIANALITHSFKKDFFSTSYVPGIVLGHGDSHKQDRYIFVLRELKC